MISFELFLKMLPWFVVFIGFIINYVILREKVNSGQDAIFTAIRLNTEKIKKHENLLTSGVSGGAPFITDSEHDKLQGVCQREIHNEIESIKDDISEMKETMKEGDECRKEARVETAHQFSAMRKEFGVFYTNMHKLITPLVSKVAVQEVEIDHLKDKIKK